MKSYIKLKLYVISGLMLVVFCVGAKLSAQEVEQSVPKPSTPFDQITPSIVGGNPSVEGNRTYTVMLGTTGGSCGGTIIGDQWILTAAHCGSWNSVRVGAYRRTANEGQVHTVTQRIVHESYSSVNGGYDVALLKVSPNINAAYVRAKIPTAAVMQAVGQPGNMVTVTGWGTLSSGGSVPSVLYEVDVPIVSQATCNAPNAYNGGINSTMICAGYAQGGKDSCQGDSGGPLVATYQNEVYSIGIVSWGEGCAAPNKYGVYAHTYNLSSWINSKIGGTQPTPTPNPTPTPPPSNNVLVKGVVKTGLAGAAANETVYTMQVPAGATGLNFAMSGGTGDADLYVRFGSAPTTSTYDCRPYLSGNNETCNITTAQTGTYYVMLRAYSAYSGVSLVGNYSTSSPTPTPTPTPTPAPTPVPSNQLQNGVTKTGLGASTNGEVRYTMVVPAGASNLNFVTNGGSGDADLYVRFGSAPTTATYDCRPYLNGNNETCTITSIQAGTYHVMLRAYSTFSNVSLTGSHN